MKTKTKSHLKTAASVMAIAAAIASAGAQSASRQNQDELEKATRLTKLQGLELVSQNGTEIGTVDDVVFSPDSGEIESLIVGTGFLGIGGPQKAIDLDRLEKRKVTDSVIRTSLSDAALEKAEDFTAEQLENQDRTDGEYDNVRTGDLLALKYKNHEVEDVSGEYVGEVHDWIVDVNNGRVPFVVLRKPKTSAKAFSHAYNYMYYAVNVDKVVGIRDDELIVDVNSDEFVDARIVDEPSIYSVDAENAVYEFRYEPN